MDISYIPSEKLFDLLVENKLDYLAVPDGWKRIGPINQTLRFIDSRKHETTFFVNEELTKKTNERSTFPVAFVERTYSTSSVKQFILLVGIEDPVEGKILLAQEVEFSGNEFLYVDRNIYLPYSELLEPSEKHLHLFQTMKQLFIDVISEDPAYRLFVVTGMLELP